MGPFSELALVSEHRAGSPILSLVGGLGGPVCGPTQRWDPAPRMPTHHLSAASTRCEPRKQVSALLCVWATQLGLHVLGDEGEGSRVDPAVVQAGTWEQERQKSEALRALRDRDAAQEDAWWGPGAFTVEPMTPRPKLGSQLF